MRHEFIDNNNLPVHDNEGALSPRSENVAAIAVAAVELVPTNVIIEDLREQLRNAKEHAVRIIRERETITANLKNVMDEREILKVQLYKAQEAATSAAMTNTTLQSIVDRHMHEQEATQVDITEQRLAMEAGMARIDTLSEQLVAARTEISTLQTQLAASAREFADQRAHIQLLRRHHHRKRPTSRTEIWIDDDDSRVKMKALQTEVDWLRTIRMDLLSQNDKLTNQLKVSARHQQQDEDGISIKIEEKKDNVYNRATSGGLICSSSSSSDTDYSSTSDNDGAVYSSARGGTISSQNNHLTSQQLFGESNTGSGDTSKRKRSSWDKS